MHKLKISILLLIFSITSIAAQNNADAETLITDLIQLIKSTAFRTDFTLSVNQKNQVTSQSMSGKFIMKGSKFFLDSESIKVWYDGKTQWGLNIESKEVSVTEPTEQELSDTNPLSVLASYKSKCTTRLSKSKSNFFNIIEMTPKVRNNDFSKIEVRTEKSTGNPVKISVYEKSGNVSVLTLSKFQKNIKVNESDFIFDKTKFKGVTINDLR